MSKHAVVNESAPVALDSTQTLRVLTLPELQDANQPKWFVVQLAISGQPINLDTMPRLDAFASYRLYSVVGRQNTAAVYALRLGFFNEEVSANVVCGYLKTFFASPRVVRVSAAEQSRFAGPSHTEAQLQKPARGEANVQRASMRGSTGTSFVARSTLAKSGDTRGSHASASASAANAYRSPSAVKPVVSQSIARSPAPVLKQSVPPRKSVVTGSSPTAVKKTKSLGEELLEEARQIQLSKTGRHRPPEQTGSWLSRLLGGSKT